MSTNSTVITPRFLVGVMLGASLALIGLAVWMIVHDEGSPVFVALAGAFLAAFATIMASQTKKKR